MAVQASRVIAGTESTKLAENTSQEDPTIRPGTEEFKNRRVLLKNVTQTASVFLGPQGITTGNGFEWAAGDGPLEIELECGEELFGIVAATPQTIHVLSQGR